MIRALLACLFFALPLTAPASEQWQDLEGIRAGVIRFALQETSTLPGKTSIAAGPLEPRLHLPRCGSIEYFVPPGSRLWGSSNVGVRCAAPSPWTVYVPLTVKVTADIVFAARPLITGQKLAEADILLKSGDLTQFSAGVITDPQQAVGKTATSSVPAGYPLRLDMLRASLVIQQGQSVRIVAQGQGFQVNSEGKAQHNAAAGQIVSVRLPSGKIIKGTARENGVVEVPF